MQRGVELRCLEEEATFERRVQRQVRRCVSRGSVKGQMRVRWARGKGDGQGCVACVCVDTKISACARGSVGRERDVGVEGAVDAEASVGTYAKDRHVLTH
jgi:hypothetical protein